MTPFRAVLALHILAGGMGLVLGPLAMLAPKRPGRYTRLGEAYHWVLLVGGSPQHAWPRSTGRASGLGRRPRV